jgi:hypothetical protein
VFCLGAICGDLSVTDVFLFVRFGPSMYVVGGGCVDLLPSGVSLIGGDITLPMCESVFQCVSLGPNVSGLCGVYVDLLPSGFGLVGGSPRQCVGTCFSLLVFGPRVFVLNVVCVDLLPSGVGLIGGDLAAKL